MNERNTSFDTFDIKLNNPFKKLLNFLKFEKNRSEVPKLKSTLLQLVSISV